MGNKQTHNTTDSKNVGDTRSSRALEGENREQCREVEDGNSPLNELFLELKLMVLGFLDARSLHAMLFVNHSLHELIHSTGGQNGLWLPLLSQQLHHKDTEQTLRMYPEADNTNWKALFVEALQIPSFDPKGHLYFSLTDSAHTATLAGSGVHSYKCARTIKPILPNSSTYFEVEVRQNSGSVMVGVMTDVQPLEFGIPTQNFYHGYCVNYTHFNSMKNPHIGVHVISEEDKVVLHYFLNGSYIHSQQLRSEVYYPAITAGSVEDCVAYVRPEKIPAIPPPRQLHWPQHPFKDATY